MPTRTVRSDLQNLSGPATGSQAPFRFRLITIGRSGEIEFVSRRGRSLSTRHFVLVCLAVAAGPPRVVIKASRKVGGAVVRNRIRRRIKEILRKLFPRLQKSCDCLVIVRTAAAQARFTELSTDLEYLLRKHGYLKDGGG
jgi:ribonuclease P protein component